MRVLIEADGASRGNPGPAGYGCVVWSADHQTVLAEHGQAIGITTNNVAAGTHDYPADTAANAAWDAGAGQ